MQYISKRKLWHKQMYKEKSKTFVMGKKTKRVYIQGVNKVRS